MRLGNSALESNDDHLSSDAKPCPVTHQLRLRHAFSEINVHNRKTDISKEKGSILPVCVEWEPPVNDTASSSASERIIIRVTVSSRGGLSQSGVVSTLNLLRAAFQESEIDAIVALSAIISVGNPLVPKTID